MKKVFFLFITILFSLLFLINYNFNNYNLFSSVENKVYYNSNDGLDFISGNYLSSDGLTIKIGNDNSILFENTYSLTLKSSNRGNTISGNIGSDKKSVTFYQLNDSTIMSDASITYTHDGKSVTIHENTVFKLNKTIEVNESGKIELYNNDTLISRYTSLQDAVDSASDGYIVKVLDNLDVVGATYINKNIVLDGNNKTLNYSTWSNSVFVVEEGVNAEIKNLTIDGGSKDFKVDYDSVTYNDYNIPLIDTENDIKQTFPAMISKGNITVNNLNFQNIYSTNGSSLKVVRGSANINDSVFYHNRASIGGAVYIGSSFRKDQSDYSVESVKFNNTKFENNYSTAGGGAVYVIHTDTVEFDNCKFLSNTTTSGSGYGGAIYINKNSTKVSGKTYNSTGHSKGLDFPQIKIDNSVFDNNWAGNDGYAIQNYEGVLDINNTTFKNNVGVSKSSSVGTISVYVMRDGVYANQKINNSLFEKNKGPVSCIGDHGTLSSFDISNTKFVENEGSRSIYLLTGVANIDKCEFIRDKSTSASIYLLPCDYEEYYNGSEYNKPVLKVSDSLFENANGNYDIESATYDNDDYIKSEIILSGNNIVNIDLTDANYLKVNGKIEGKIRLDRNTFVGTHLIYGENGEFEGELIDRKLIVNYKNLENKDVNLEIFVPQGQDITPFYVNQLLGLEKEGYLLYFYNEPEYTSKWDYKTVKDKTIYGNWEEHHHAFTLTKKDNMLLETCECGKTGKKLFLQKPSNLEYDGNVKTIQVINELGITDTDYKISYSVKNSDGTWGVLNGLPTNGGVYKAKLTYNDLSVEIEYEVLGSIENPKTGNNLSIYLFIFLIIMGIISVILLNKKSFRQISL